MNVLKPHLHTTVMTLLAAGTSQREIAPITSVDRNTIRSLAQRPAGGASNSPRVATGSDDQFPPPRPPAPPIISPSACEPHRAFITDQHLAERLRRELGLRCKQKRKFEATKNSKHALPVAPNLLEQTFAPKRPNEAWVSDITNVSTDKGWRYLAGIKDVFTCEMVGYALAARMTQELTAQALWRAVRSKRQAPGLILHSERGSQYCADDDRKLVAQFGMQASIRARGTATTTRPWTGRSSIRFT